MSGKLAVSFPTAPDACPSIVVSDQVALEPGGDGTATLRFARKAPVNFENLVYFCGGYIDPRTRNYYVCAHRMDAVYPLFTLDGVMPEQSPLSAEDMAKMIALFSPEDGNVFEGVWHNPFTASFVARQDCFPVVDAAIGAIVSKRMLLNKMGAILFRYAGVRPVPVEAVHVFHHFLEHVREAEHHLKSFMLHWTVLEMRGIYPRAANKMLAAVFDFPLFEKARGKLDYADRDLLTELWEGQRDGSLEDDAFFVEED